MPFTLDPNLKDFATRKQWKKLEALDEHGSTRKAAKALGIHKNTIQDAKQAVLRKAAQRGYAPEYDMVHPAPDGYLVKGVSTLYGPHGEIKAQWNKTEIDKDRQFEMFKEAIAGLTDPLPRADATKAPKTERSDLLAVYPVGDHHLGMLSWKKETGSDYDLKIGEQLLNYATDYLVEASPSCDEALIIFLGDFFHYDSFMPVTPTSRNLLDTDTRYPKMVRTAFRCIRYMIGVALEKHKNVRVIVEIGNHDLSSSIFLMEALNNIYEDEDRVYIDTSPMHYHYYKFGTTLIGVHHGHGAKMKDLGGIMATDRPKDWGDTNYRYWYTGHVHHDKKIDLYGCSAESFRILAPNDAWSHQKGYRSQSDMKSIIIHNEYGEQARNTVNPRMFGE